MTDTAFISDIRLPDLGSGAEYAVFGLRACARGAVNCCAMKRVFESVLGEDGNAARQTLYTLAYSLGHDGRRLVSLGVPGTARVTSDELSFIAALAAAQCDEEHRLHAHLTWLFAGPYANSTEVDILQLASLFYAHGVEITSPQLDIPHAPSPLPGRPVGYFGRA